MIDPIWCGNFEFLWVAILIILVFLAGSPDIVLSVLAGPETQAG